MILITPTDLKLAANDLPPSPQVFGKLSKLLRDPFTGLNDITDLVNTDAKTFLASKNIHVPCKGISSRDP
jgi:hypothetical protein